MLELGHVELQFLLQDLKLKLAFSLRKKGVRPGVKVGYKSSVWNRIVLICFAYREGGNQKWVSLTCLLIDHNRWL